MTLRKRFRSRLKLALPGPDSQVEARFYEPSPTCQIPELYFLLELFLGKRSDGVFVEVGAYDGYSFSNTYGLAKVGWQGLCIEPVPEFAERCRALHAGHRVRVLEAAVGASRGRLRMTVAGALSTANAAMLADYQHAAWAAGAFADAREIDVEQTTLDEILEREAISTGFDVLVVDVEGQECAVFEAFDVARWHPQLMIVELADTHPDLPRRRSDDAKLLLDLTDLGYRIVYKDKVNTVLVKEAIYQSTYRLTSSPK
jgi:FkbM family methyltransferase